MPLTPLMSCHTDDLGGAECQSAANIDPLSASKIDPFWHRESWPDAV